MSGFLDITALKNSKHTHKLIYCILKVR
jgi:hypothetical protein